MTAATAKRGRGRPRTDPALLEARGAFRTNPNRAPEKGPDGKFKAKREALPEKDYAAIALRYAEDIVAGRIVAGRKAKLACARHLRDLERAETDPNWKFMFDAAKANAFCARIEQFPHIKGRWAAKQEKIELQPWQCFAVAVPFGWVHKVTRLRRFRKIYLRVARKNAKSTLAAAIGLVMLLDDAEFGAEVYAGATTEKQAWEVFGPAKLMLERSPRLLKEYGAEVFARAIVKPADNSRFWPIIGKPGDGSSPSCAIADEYHEHDTSDLVDTMETGMGSREQPMMLIITTAGTNLASPCHDLDKDCVKILQGTIEDETLFALIYDIDEEDDWTDPEVLPKANPNLDVSVSRDFLITQLAVAKSNSAYQNRFKTKHLNMWCGASVAGINMASWANCADRDLRIEQFAGEPMHAALDLASKVDICSYMRVFVRLVDGERHYYAFGKHYLPEETIAEAKTNQLAYRKWVVDGWLTQTEGAEIEFDRIRDDVLADKSQYQLKEIAYDPWRATQLAQQLRAEGATTVEMGQTARNMAEAFDELLAAIKSGRFHHNGDPALEWMASNTLAKTVAKGMVIPAKDKPEQKIDAIVSLTMAISRAMVADVGTAVADWLTNPVMG